MKILNREQIRAADQATIVSEGITSVELMERAAKLVFNLIQKRYLQTPEVLCRGVSLFCGAGNNGGDGLVVARLLHQINIPIQVYLVKYQSYSSDFQINLERLIAIGVEPILLDSNTPLINIEADLIVDAIFGIGLNRAPEEWVRKIIRAINDSKVEILSIDVPSGLFLEQPVKDWNSVIKATITVTFQSPKLVFYFPETAEYVGQLEILDLKLDATFLDNLDGKEFLTTKPEAARLYSKLSKYAHKGTQGHCLVIGGSYGKIGAITLTSRAALRTGCGLVTAYIPRCGYQIIQTANPEVMVITDIDDQLISEIQFNIKPQSIVIGMGLGQAAVTHQALTKFLKTNQVPLVIDADALNIIAQNKELMKLIPSGSILTPHPKELERLIGTWKNDHEKLDHVKKLSTNYNLIVVIKGAPAMIVQNDLVFVNTTGNPSLATAGSGDVLSGMIGSLLAQRYSSINAARLAVYLHGLTADLVGKEQSPESFIASDIINNLGKAFQELHS